MWSLLISTEGYQLSLTTIRRMYRSYFSSGSYTNDEIRVLDSADAHSFLTAEMHYNRLRKSTQRLHDTVNADTLFDSAFKKQDTLA